MTKCKLPNEANKDSFHECVTTQINSDKWLKKYGLKKLKLDFPHILSTIGLTSQDDYVSILQKPVSSRYAKNLFKKISYNNGATYNLIGTKKILKNIESRLKDNIGMYKDRLEWLSTESRQVFGIIEETTVCIIIDVVTKDENLFQSYMRLLISLLEQQLVYCKKINFMRSAYENQKWQHNCTEVTADSVSSAVSWLMDLPSHTEYSTTSVLESVLEAVNDLQADEIFIFTDTTLCNNTGREILYKKVQDIKRQPIHVAVVNCENLDHIEYLKDFAQMTSGRFTSSTLPINNLSITSLSCANARPNGSLPSGVFEVWQELDEARTTLADLQYLIMEQKRSSNIPEDPKDLSVSADSPDACIHLSSKEWLKRFGLKANKLTLNQTLGKMVFNHCDGVVDIQHSSPQGDIEVRKTLVNAKYCDEFAHVRWFDGSLKHVQITETLYSNHKEKAANLLAKYKQRLEWLQSESRELFGAITENNIVILLDTSCHINNGLNFLKTKTCELLTDQLPSKQHFNFIQFNEKVRPWQITMMDCKEENLESAKSWVKSLYPESNDCNILDALQFCYTFDNIDGIYLVTSCTSEQTAADICAIVRKDIPVHTICCQFGESNEPNKRLCFELAKVTGGRFHSYPEDSNEQMFQSEDVSLLRSEVKKSEEIMDRMTQLFRECREKQAAKKYRKYMVETKNGKPKCPISSYVNNKAAKLRTQAVEDECGKMEENTKKKKPLKLKPDGSNAKKWIRKYGLKACKLSIVDELAVTVVSRKPTYVPILGKDVLSKVFGDGLPLIKVCGKEKELQVLNPQSVNLSTYQNQMKRWIERMERKSSSLAVANMSEETKIKFEVDSSTSLSKCKEVLRQANNNEPGLVQFFANIKPLTDEIIQAELYLKQAQDLQAISNQLMQEAKEKRKEQLSLEHKNQQKPAPSEKPSLRMRYHRVIARQDYDGLYYPALVNKCINSRFVNVCFDNGEDQLTSVQHVISLGGSRPCPPLKPGDYVLVKSPFLDVDDEEEGYCYVPAIVQVIPLKMKSSSNFYTVIRYQGTKITVLRKDMLKINRTKFSNCIRFIHEAETAARTLNVAQHPPNGGNESSSHSTSSQRSDSSTDNGDEQDLDSPDSSEDDRSDDEIVLSMRESDSEKNEKTEEGNETQNNDDDEEQITSPEDEVRKYIAEEKMIAAHLDEWKQKLEAEHSAKLHELEAEKTNLLELGERLKENEKMQSVQQNMLEQQQKVLLQDQQSFLQKQIDLQRVEQKIIKEEYTNMSKAHLTITQQQQVQHADFLRKLLEAHQNQLEQQSKLKVMVKDEQTEISDELRNASHTPPPRLSTPDMLDGSRPDTLRESTGSRATTVTESTTKPSFSNNNGDSEMKMFVHPMSEAVLLAQGESGILVSRNPLETDPAVEVNVVPCVLSLNQQVLMRIQDDGWYYKGIVRKMEKAGCFIIEDGLSDMHQVLRDDIISDDEDTDVILRAGDCVVALHPAYEYAYAPGRVVNLEIDGALDIKFHDGQTAIVPRAEAYFLPSTKYERDCAFIKKCEDALIGQAVVCRDDITGRYSLAAVRNRAFGTRNYVIEWTDQTLVVQNFAYIFGSHTKRQPFQPQCHCLAIADQESFTYLPGIIQDINGSSLKVQFCNSDDVSSAESSHAFWISPTFYQEAVEYWKEKAR